MNKISITIYGPNTHYFSVLKVKPLKKHNHQMSLLNTLDKLTL